MKTLLCGVMAVVFSVSAVFMTGASVAQANSKKALVVVSFGTTFEEARQNDIEGIENALKKAFPDREFRRAFTSKIVMKRMLENQGIKVNDLETTLKELKAEGYEDILIQPTHLIHGEEYEGKVLGTVSKFEKEFAKVSVGKPLMTDEKDYAIVATALATQFPALEKDEAVIFMGHGSPRDNNKSFGNTYKTLQAAFDAEKMSVLIGVVEEVDHPNFEDMYAMFKERGYKSAVFMPLMVVSGDHANNDMAGDEEDSWKSMIEKDGYKTKVQFGGIGRNVAIQAIYVEHALEALK
ncbi:sirohydrochlorin cobaltochelatase [Anaerosinus gibii]|uniref:Sirohydrochlorin cobaltochelatase n=1 Tax=Selenobaculum gibii TaxID=3054208 RepID=A0A9Y2AIE0_9FIRM|nr:sirohydrochlorin cobaltochelatase [Selenobaculum gbiensis]WIW69990.1 sirohydrochlorin cobaltochelatase [Selenobaculum gbiensis]